MHAEVAAVSGVDHDPSDANGGVFSLQELPGLEMSDGVHDFSNFSLGINKDIHIAGGIPFDIPPLLGSPDNENIHMAGGMAFEIPPLDFSFDIAENENQNVTSVIPVTYPTSEARSTFSNLATTESSGQDSRVPLEATAHDSGAGGDLSTQTAIDNRIGFSSHDAGLGEATTASLGGNDFGDFSVTTLTTAGGDASGGFGTFPPPPSVTSGFGGFLENSAAATLGSDAIVGTAAGGEDFGGFSSTSLAKPEDGSAGKFFGDFDAALLSDAVIAETTTMGGDFGEFGGFSPNPVTGEDSWGEFGGDPSVPITKADGFGAFPTATSKDDDFGEFGGFSSNPAPGTLSGDEFGGFSSNLAPGTSGDDFGEFGSFSGVPADAVKANVNFSSTTSHTSAHIAKVREKCSLGVIWLRGYL